MEDDGTRDTHGLTSFCPTYHRAVELIGRRWTGAILRALLTDVRRFNELAAAVPGLSDRMLAERLRELESEGVVVRDGHSRKPRSRRVQPDGERARPGVSSACGGRLGGVLGPKRALPRGNRRGSRSP